MINTPPTPTYCLSSHLMSALLTWRNPDGDETNMLAGEFIVANERKFQWVVTAVTEVCLPFITVAASVEIIAYSVLGFLSVYLTPITNKPLDFFVSLIISSGTTVCWSLADIFYYNLFSENVITNESFVKSFVGITNEMDEKHLEQFKKNSNIGSLLITKFIMAETDANTIEKFRETDPSIFPFLLTKAAFYYVLGPGKNRDIPNFLKNETRQTIDNLRIKYDQTKPSNELVNALKTLTNYETPLTNPIDHQIFIDLSSAGSNDLQGGTFLTDAYTLAVKAFGGII